MSGSDWGQRAPLGLSVAGLIITLTIALAYPYWVGHGSGYKDAETKHYQTEYAERTGQRIKDCASNADAALLAECIEEAVTANHEDQRSESDLNAQRQMADWAFWALVVASVSAVTTAVGTGFLLWQIVLTRQAVEDTGEATEAMRKANELATDAQRAWIKLETRVTKFEVRENRVTIAIEATATNIGKTVARGIAFKAIIYRSEGVLDSGLDVIQREVAEQDTFRTQLAPGERLSHWCEAGWTYSALDRNSIENGHFNPMIFAAAHYRSIGVEDACVAERAFAVFQGDEFEPFKPRGIEYPLDDTIKADQIRTASAGRTRIT